LWNEDYVSLYSQAPPAPFTRELLGRPRLRRFPFIHRRVIIQRAHEHTRTGTDPRVALYSQALPAPFTRELFGRPRLRRLPRLYRRVAAEAVGEWRRRRRRRGSGDACWQRDRGGEKIGGAHYGRRGIYLYHLAIKLSIYIYIYIYLCICI